MRRISLALLTIALACGVAFGQPDTRVEITPHFGYSWSEGISTERFNIGIPDFDRVTPISGNTWGIDVDVFAGDSDSFSLGFIFSTQNSELRAEGPLEDFTIDAMDVRNYHFKVGYTVGEEEDSVRPYFFGGIGATQFSPETLGGSTKFSTTWGGGVKFFAAKNIGFRLEGRWTPTYIASNPEGFICSPFICYQIVNANYSHAFDINAGVIIRF